MYDADTAEVNITVLPADVHISQPADALEVCLVHSSDAVCRYYNRTTGRTAMVAR